MIKREYLFLNIPIVQFCSVQYLEMHDNKNNIPATTWANVSRSKQFRKYLSNTPRKHEFKELQKTAVLGAAHVLRK